MSLDDTTPDEWTAAARKIMASRSKQVDDEVVADMVAFTECGVTPVAERRKQTPVFSGVLKYFPKALQEVARCSKAGNDQHNPGKELFWDRGKSGDELDALTRHLLEAGSMDSDGIRHSAKVAWRALANLEKELEKAGVSDY